MIDNYLAIWLAAEIAQYKVHYYYYNYNYIVKYRQKACNNSIFFFYQVLYSLLTTVQININLS